MNEKRNFDYKRLHPFKWYILENFPFLEDSIDVLTNYQLFCKLGEMYNKEIDSLNALGIQVEGITDWFDNLDVQEEVNKKLDEMAEDGTLDDLFNHMYKYNYNYINLENFIAENKTDDKIISEAIAECIEHEKNLVFPNNKTFYVTQSFNLQDIKVDGNNSKIICNLDNLPYIFTSSNYVDIKNIEIDLNGKGYSFIENKHFSDIRLNNIICNNNKTTLGDDNYSLNGAIYLDGLNVNVENLKTTYNKGHGIVIDASENDSIYYLNNIISNYNGNNTNNISHGLVHNTRTRGSNYKQITITNSTFNNNRYSGLTIHQAQNCSISNVVCNNNGEHGLVLQDGKNGNISNSQFNNNVACGIRIQGDFSHDDELTGYFNSCVSNCIINGVYGIGISNNVKKCVITNNVINVTRYTVYISKNQTNEKDSSDIIIKDNYLYSTDSIVSSDVVVYGSVDNLIIKNVSNGIVNSRTRYYSNGIYQDLNSKEYGDIKNILVDPKNMLSSNWSKYGTVADDLIIANTGGYYVGQVVTLTKNTDYLSIILAIDPDRSNEDALGYNIDLQDDSNNVIGTIYNRRFVGGYSSLSQTFKISDFVNSTAFTKVRIRIAGTNGKYIKPLYCYMNQSSILPIIENT